MNQTYPILIVCTGIIDVKQKDALGGAHVHNINLYQNLLKAGVNTTLLISAKSTPSKMEEAIKKLGLPYHTIFHAGPLKNRLLFKTYLIWVLIKLCKKLGPCIVQCNNKAEIWAARVASKFVPLKIIFTRHNPQIISHHRLQGVIGALASGHQTKLMLNNQNKRINESIKIIDDLPMFYHQEKFLNYQASTDRETFFRTHFNVIIPKDAVVLCMIANLYSDLNHKNHPLLLNAFAQIIKKHPNNVHLILAGAGPAEAMFKNLAQKLGITPVVHFLGFSDQTPGILHHSDIFVLSSKEEAFGIVYLEAALMKKPLVGATNTGAENVVIMHEKTGLLFKNNDVADLAIQLERLITDKDLRIQLGKNAYEHVRMNHSNEAGLEKMLSFYTKVALL